MGARPGSKYFTDKDAIRNAGWMVRNYRRGASMRATPQAERRAEAIKHLGLIVRDAFNRSDNFEPLLVAIVDGLRPLPEDDPF